MKNKLPLILFIFYLCFYSTIALCQPTPVANFTVSTCSSLTVTFNNTSVGATTYLWNFGDPSSGLNDTSSLLNPTHIYAANNTYMITLIIDAGLPTVDTSRQTIAISVSPPSANAGPNKFSCTLNPSTLLNGSVSFATGGIWSGPGMFSPDSTTLTGVVFTSTSSPAANEKDTLFLTTIPIGGCPTAKDTLIITYQDGGPAITVADTTVCASITIVTITASNLSAAGGVQWSTNGLGNLTNANQLTVTYQPTLQDKALGFVRLFIATTNSTNSNCYSAKDTVTITFTPLPVVSITSTDSICSSDTLVLSASSSTNAGSWSIMNGSGTFSPANGIFLNGDYIPSPNDINNGSVQLKFTSDSSGTCPSQSDTLSVTINPSPIAVFSGMSVCALTPLTFTQNSSVSPGSIVGWSWNFGDSTAIDTAKTPTHSFNSGGSYPVTLTVTSNAGCTHTTTHPVKIFYKPVANFAAVGICKTDGTWFYDSSTVVLPSTITSWIWSFGDGDTCLFKDTLHQFPSNTTYTVTLTVQSSDGCIGTTTQSVSVVNNPIANFTANPEIANVNQSISFTDISTGAPNSWLWNFGDLDFTAAQHPTHSYDQEGYYQVCLTIADTNGCRDTICKLEIISVPPAVPSGFSPNGDGNNDVFYVYGGPFRNLLLNVYNNWGELIFTSSNQQTGWDGTYKGVEQPIGVYVYTVVATTEQGETIKLSGDVTLLR